MDVITYPYLDQIYSIMGVITYPGWDYSQSMLVKGAIGVFKHHSSYEDAEMMSHTHGFIFHFWITV